jgi:drug/metabolite transporter (DMT)-like permease
VKPAGTKGWILAAFLISTLLGGFNAIGVRFTVQELAPFWGATLRFAPAGLLLFLLSLVFHIPFPKGRGMWGAILFGAINFGGSYAFIYWGIQKVQPGMVQVILALVPLLTMLFAISQRRESFRMRALLGALMAVIGIAVVFGNQAGANVPLTSLFAVVLGAACFAEAGVLVKGFPQNHPIATNAIGMCVGAVILFLISILAHETFVLPIKVSTWVAVGYLVLFGSCVVFILVLYILRYWPASTVAYQFVLLPFVTLAGSAWLTQEQISPMVAVGGALVLLGVFFGALAPSRKRQLDRTPEAGV